MSREYKNDGRDQIPIEHLTGNVYIGDQRSRKRPDREVKWLKAFEKEILGRLATSLHNQILINLGKEIDLDQVRRLWDMEVKSGQITEAIAPDTEILSVFDRADIQGKLLILGKPGAGKTTTLLELAQSLVKKALDDPSAPMPILLNLSSWKDPRLSLKDWTIVELTTKGIGSKISAKWLEDQKLLPLLDGLDEVRSDLQPACVRAINQFLTGEGKPEAIVVCSRREEYELYPQKLDLNGAIYLQELSDAQIEQYLSEVNRLNLWQVLGADAELRSLVRQPLLLSITLVAYREELAERWQALRSTQERLDFLLDAYVEKMLHRSINSRMYNIEKEPPAKQTRRWLVNLARQLQSESESEFLIERMQPAWLIKNRQQCFYRLVFSLISGLISAIVFGLIGAIVFGSMSRASLLDLLVIGLILGSVSGLISGLKNINTVEKLQICFTQAAIKRATRNISSYLIDGMRIGLIFGLSFGLISMLSAVLSGALSGPLLKVLFFALIVVLIAGLSFGMIAALVEMLIRVLIDSLQVDVESRIRPNRPNQGISRSINNVALCVALAVVIAAFIQTLLLQTYKSSITELNNIALLLQILVWFSFQWIGGQACIQHFSLRLVLFRSHAIPWNFARFLNYATERMFLQRVGGRYRFVHKLLQEHLAKG
ncbi:NACHT domain-containing protein [Phormidesmis priestleyi ULC007]|uniref:NACHT domain-containing protein n=1 Tax=Phormidesmis priestleyi ULC007 TaxID=1920490 RepID=A0A2T1D5J1_9CYAN|nr:NACHT domain-containing protein [Phormidesmis priestleyi]PSB15792.1 NACHT domain-containing protein [Phormidesmis priestleyi ULC007]PZO46813.1 MAG: NACHT domain-containing protein [Phormidesmis priestleyi]